MKRLVITTLLLIPCWAVYTFAQSPLDGVSFQASTYNMRLENVGVVRLTNVTGSNCRVEDGPLGNDVPSAEDCLTLDSGEPAVDVTFGAGPQAVGDVTVEPRATVFDGLATPIEIFNVATDVTATTDVYAEPGELLEFVIRSPDNEFPAGDDIDFWGFSATGIQYPNAMPDSVVGLPFDEVLENYTNFYFWYEGEDGPLTEGYEVGLPEALGVGRHPTDPDREVLYPIYSRGQADDQTDTVAGGSLDFHSHGSILNASPQIGNLLVLADNTVNFDFIDPLDDVVGFGLGVLVHPPEAEDIGPICDPNTQGDIDGDGQVAFADFLVLSANFGTEVDGSSQGDIDCSGDVQFADFLILSSNFGTSVGAAASVPEPSSSVLLLISCLFGLMLRRRS